MKFNSLVLVALLGSTTAHKLIGKNQHACDFIDESGEEISSSLVDNQNEKPISITNVQLKDDAPDTVEEAREKFALMQAQMDANVQAADQKKAEQDAQAAQVTGDDPQSQLQGLMNAQQSLKRISSAF